MNKSLIEKIVTSIITDYCKSVDENVDITLQTNLIGENRVLDSMGLVNVIVDVESAFTELNYVVTLTSEAAMSSRISPFRSVESLCNFISQQLNINE